jgi:type IV secretion system protein VirB5
MNMQIKTRVLSLAAALVLSVSGTNAQASGIPTVDVAAIAQAVTDAMQQAMEAADQLTAAQDQIAELQEQYQQSEQQFLELKNMTTGNSKYGNNYWDEELVDYIPTTATAGSWEEIYRDMDAGTLNGYREKYGLKSDNTTQQEVFDVELTNLHTMQSAHRANNLRLENIKNLQAEADAAETPQEKQDIQARLMAEQAAISNESNRLATVESLMARNDKFLAQKQNKEFSDFLETGEE